MKNILLNPRSAAIIGLVLALPYMTILSLILLKIEPSFGLLDPLITALDSRHGSFIFLGALLLSIAALIINLTLIARNVRAGMGVAANPMNLLLAGVILFFIAALLAGIIIDQYPCWIGVPNCD